MDVVDITEESELVAVVEGNKQLPTVSISKREIEVLKLVCEGFTVKEIAGILYVSTHTVISHKQNLLVKFQARNSVDLAVRAIRSRIIPF